MKNKPSRFNLPNLLSASRLIAAPLMLGFAWREMQTSFVIMLSYIIITDILDGWIARAYNMVSDFGANLDSLGDIVFYLSLVPSLFFLWPSHFQQAQWFVIVGIFSFLLPFIICLIKFKTMPSFHTWSAKFAAIVLPPVLFMWFYMNWAIAAKCYSMYIILVALEHCFIILKLQHWQSNVRSFFHLSSNLIKPISQ